MPTVRIQLERAALRYRVLLDGVEIGMWKDPECSAARWLIDNGRASRDDTLRVYQGAAPCMAGRVGWFADRRAIEDDRDGTPRFKLWRPNPFAASGRIGQKTASDDMPVCS
jgi:hypothetical protein